MSTGKKIKVDDTKLGVWIPGASVNNPVEFSVAIVDLAVKNGLEIDTAQWEADRPLWNTEEASFEMVEDLGYITDFALDYLNSNVTEGYYFDFGNGLILVKNLEEEQVTAE